MTILVAVLVLGNVLAAISIGFDYLYDWMRGCRP